jgi:hypothetical protein
MADAPSNGVSAGGLFVRCYLQQQFRQQAFFLLALA